MSCFASRQDEDQDNGNYGEISDCSYMKVMYNRNTNYKDECIKQNFDKKECVEGRDSIENYYSTFRSTFSRQQFVR